MNNTRGMTEAVVYICATLLLVGCGSGESGSGGGSVTMPVTTGLLQSLTITPAASSVVACSAVQYVATGNYSDGTTVDVTNGVYWEIPVTSSDVAIAGSSGGQVIGIKPGIATVGAWTGAGIAASSVLNVTANSLTSIAITPATSTVAVTGTLTYTATATCTNGPIDISRMNIWSNSNSAVASISTSGVATALTVGSSVINATAGAIAASAVLNVL